MSHLKFEFQERTTYVYSHIAAPPVILLCVVENLVFMWHVQQLGGELKKSENKSRLIEFDQLSVRTNWVKNYCSNFVEGRVGSYEVTLSFENVE